MKYEELKEIFRKRNNALIEMYKCGVITREEARNRMSEHWWVKATFFEILSIDQTYELGYEFSEANEKLCKEAERKEGHKIFW